MNKKMLAILGSPHQNGPTAAMLKCSVSAAKAKGWEVTTVVLYQKQIAFCMGCRSCLGTARCIYMDDLQEIAELLKSCDRIVMAAPTYWANVPAVVKNLFDRLYGSVMEETSGFPRPLLSHKQQYLLLTSCNTPFPFSWICGQSRGSIRAMNEFFKTAGMKRLGCAVFSNSSGKTELPKRLRKKIEGFWI